MSKTAFVLLALWGIPVFGQVALLPVTTCGCDQSGAQSYSFNAGTGTITAASGGLSSSLGGFRSLAIHPSGRFAYANEVGSTAEIAAFAINAATGAMAPILGSPFGSFVDGGSGAALAVDPSGKFLYLENVLQTDETTFSVSLSGYTIDPVTGALTMINGSPFSVPGSQFTTASLAIDPSSQFLYVVQTNATSASGAISSGTISGFTINTTTGALLPMAGSPFPAGTLANTFTILPDGKFAYATNGGDNTVSGYMLDQVTGALTTLAGSPFATGKTPDRLTIDPTGQFAYVEYEDETISGFSIDAKAGALTPTPGAQITGQMLSIDPSGSFAYANMGSVLASYLISPTTGALSPLATTQFNGAAAGPLAFVPLSNVALVQSASNTATSMATIGAVFPSPPTAGNLIVVFIRKSSPNETVELNDSLGNVFVEAIAQADSVDEFDTHIFYAANIHGGAKDAVTIKISNTSNHVFLAIYEFAGLSAVAPLDRTSSAIGTYTAVASSGPTGASTSANELIFSGAGFSSGSTGTVTAEAGYTLLQHSPLGASEFKVVNAIGSANPTFALSVPTDWAALTATFVAAPYTPPLGVVTTSLTNARGGETYSYSLLATGGVSPYSWSVTAGTLPAGLSLSASTGVISGTPSASSSATSSFTVQVTDAKGTTSSQALTLLVNVVSLVQSAQASGPALTQLQVGLPNAFTPGDLIVVFLRSSGTLTPTVTDNLALTYLPAISQTQSENQHSTHIYYLTPSNPNVTTVTATFAASNDHPFMAVYEFSGVSTLDQSASAQGTNATVSVQAAAATSGSTELVFVGSGYPFSWGGTASVESGYDLLVQDGGAGAAAEFMVVHSATVAMGGFGLSNATDWTGVMATFK